MRRPTNPRPVPRTNPSGKRAWVARYPCKDGRYKSAGTEARKGDAQKLIDAAMDREWSATTKDTFGGYFETWIDRHPRSKRTNTTNKSRIRVMLDAEIEGVKLRDWRYADLRRRHAVELVDLMLRGFGEYRPRTHSGAQGILRALSAMSTDAVNDEVIEVNLFMRVTVRRNDPRILASGASNPEVRVWTFEQMHTFAAACGPYEPAVRVLSDCGPRVSEMLAIYQECVDRNTGMLCIKRAIEGPTGRILEGTKTTHRDARKASDGRLAPIPETLLQMLWEMPWREDTPLLFPTPSGRAWNLSNFYRDVWRPAQRATGLDIRPHEMRHSWFTHLAAAGVDVADLAEMGGNSVETINGRYYHAKNQSYDAVRGVIG